MSTEDAGTYRTSQLVEAAVLCYENHALQSIDVEREELANGQTKYMAYFTFLENPEGRPIDEVVAAHSRSEGLVEPFKYSREEARLKRTMWTNIHAARQQDERSARNE